ncbi:MAG TPA: TlpA disulfide reductase family protein [Euzebyales bacterium]
MWVFLGVLVVLFGVLAFVSRSTGPAAEITEATASGEALPPLAQGGSDPAVGSDAPELTGQTLDGESMTIEPGDGTPKAIAFLAHWCPHCQREVPTVTQWVEDGGLPEGVELVGVTTGIDRNRPNFPPQDWLEREEWPAETMVDGNNTAAQAYGLTNYPYWVLVDGDGQVVLRWSGETTPQQLSERIGQLAE